MPGYQNGFGSGIPSFLKYGYFAVIHVALKYIATNSGGKGFICIKAWVALLI